MLLLLGCAWSLKSFEGHKVIRAEVDSLEHLAYLLELKRNTTFDFWAEPARLGQSVDVRVAPEQCHWLCEQLSERHIPFRVLIEDVQALMGKQVEGREGMVTSQTGIDYTQYHTYEEIVAWLKTLPASYPTIAQLINIGKSYEGRDLLVVRISSNKTSGKAVWFDGGIHAREWISTATVVYMLGNILSDYGKDPTITSLVDGGAIYVLPVFNPDGYSYTWTDDRMWRKTRSPNAGSDCVGTDPNRNWDFQWGGAGTSTDPCDDSYCGSAPFSEIEVKTVGLYIKNAGFFKGYINFHSYSQLWMSPWGYTYDLPKDYTLQNALSGKCVAALQAVSGTQYQYGTISNTIYPASGSSADYTYNAGVLYSYGVELRDTGDYGFLLPPDQIVPSGQETYEAVKAWAIQSFSS
uniref:Peptidase M14 domain-containing protein n=1 Tax=Arcella intermedia TaxID=1963864 RepID=A0A6B2L5M5_9EUKA